MREDTIRVLVAKLIQAHNWTLEQMHEGGDASRLIAWSGIDLTLLAREVGINVDCNYATGEIKEMEVKE